MLPRIYDGSGKPAPERITLRAGKLTMAYEAGMLRYIRLGNHEIVRGIYAAVRDHNWGTIPFELRDVAMDIREDSFAITFTSDHVQGDIHFAWRGTITGTSENTIQFTFYGEALSSFKRNRVGFCVLHPMDVAGKAVDVEHVNGEIEDGEFPQLIAPHQPYFDIRALTHEVIPGLRAEVRMEGDTFEMEDQRNWTDASFKTYCTPLGLPFPVQLEAGTKISQSITVRLIGDVTNVEVRESAPTLQVGDPADRLPMIGLGAASHGEPLSARELERLKLLRLDHLRVEVDFTPGWENRLEQWWNEAQITYPYRKLQIVARLSNDAAEAQLRALRQVWNAHGMGRGCTIQLGLQGAVTTPEAILSLARGFFELDALVVGTDGYFTQLNRNRPPQLAPMIAYSTNPQVHAFDNASLVETLPVIGETVYSAQRFSDGLIWVSPVTFKIRNNPDATAPEAPTPPGELPRRVDVRQMSLFGAGWTMGAIASLALAGANSLTFYETTGWLGIMERESGSPLPDLFPSIPGGVYPMYHVFADVGELQAATVLRFESSHPLQFSGLALQSGAKCRLLIANHTQERQTITVAGISGAWEKKSIDETTADFAMRDPEGYRAAPGQTVTAGDDGLTLELLPYAVVRLDQDNAS